jgi:hypothetical protein
VNVLLISVTHEEDAGHAHIAGSRGIAGNVPAHGSQISASSPFRLSYERLYRRFQDGLGDERDRLLSQCAGLMLIKFIQQDDQGRID